MASALAFVGLAVVVAVHTAVAALVTRLLRVRLSTRWAPPLYAVVVVPIVLTASTLVVSGVFGVGPDLGGPGAALFLLVVAPLAVGLTIDYVWMPAPEEIQLPETPG